MSHALRGAFLALIVAAAAFANAAAQAPHAALGLEQIMAEADWVGAPVQDPYWAVDGRAVYYSLKRAGSPIVDLHKVILAGGRDMIVDAADMQTADANPVYDAAGKRAAFIRNGDVFVRDVQSGRLLQVTRSTRAAAAPQFSADGRVLSFRIGWDWFVYEFSSGLTAPAAILKAEQDPATPAAPDDLRDFQLRTFNTLRRAHADEEAERRQAQALQAADATRVPRPFYLGEEVVIRGSALSPDAHWLLLVTSPKTALKGRQSQLTRYVTESGYEEFETERTRVGRNPPAPQSLLLLNLADHTQHALDINALPGIDDDPLRTVREENAQLPDAATTNDAARKAVARSVWVVSDDPDVTLNDIVWSDDSSLLAVQIFAADHKDRWLVSVDLRRYSLVMEHRLHDPAWVNANDPYNAFGWLNDGRTLWFQSEESGYSQLYVKSRDAGPTALTRGRFEVTEPMPAADGRWIYFLCNAAAPYSYDVYRVSTAGGAPQRLSELQGVEHFLLQRRGRQLLLTYSSPYMRPQIGVVDAASPRTFRTLTDTRPAAYKALTWIEPEIVQIQSTHGAGVIYGKLYRDGRAAAAGPRPGVLFVHGAGYTQNVHLRSPYYFREQMFNNLLAQHGFVVLDIDYRASQGYGRDWRTAIYRQMGHPELEDLLDAKQWLVQSAQADGKRVGIYGGSYGGFMTLMALFRAPGAFAAGAALRPVTDWLQYDDEYTSEILNDPRVDPIAYRRSSPIEFADGLQDALLICHGVMDDNVLFEDSMRLYQRLIELHKTDFTLSPYPLDRHGFANADSWLDEYRRIYRLFDEHLQRQ